MDPVTVGLLAAMAGGAGGELGRQAWANLSALVRRPFGRGDGTAVAEPDISSGVAELDRLAEAPADPGRAQALSTALAVRAAVDADFRAGLEVWHQWAKRVCAEGGEVRNSISGGTQNGPVLQGRDFSEVSFNTRPPVAGDDGASPTMQG
ncbi:hypothetical protein GCM10009566_42450 [Streptomyces murinus]